MRVERSSEVSARDGAKLGCWLTLSALLGLLALSHEVSAQEAPQQDLPMVARASLGAALMTSPDQTGRLGLDTFGPTLHVMVGYVFAPWLDLHLGFGAVAYPSATRDAGAVIAPSFGPLVSLPFGGIRPFAYSDFGAAFTGPESRPYFHGAAGIDFQVTRAFTIGPLIGYAHVFQSDGPRYSTDARSVELCATLTFRPVSAEAAPRPVTYVFRDRVIEAPPPPPTPPSGDLDKLLDAALPTPKAPKASVELLAPVLFKFASDELEPVGVAMLHEVARELNKRQDIRLIEIEGYADNRGADAINVELSNRRAQRVFEWLEAHGVEPARMRVAAHGEADPVEQSAETEEAHEQNRRVVFRVIEAVAQNEAVTQ